VNYSAHLVNGKVNYSPKAVNGAPPGQPHGMGQVARAQADPGDQAQLAHDLIKAGLQVLIFNQRTLDEILNVLWVLGAVVGEQERAGALLEGYARRLNLARERAQSLAWRPRVYFEEWDDPLITSIGWVSELVELAGGQNVFRDRASGAMASERFVTHEQILAASPEVILACWCGKAVELEQIASRPGYDGLPAIKRGRLYELDPAIILQPGPAALTAGLDALEAILVPILEEHG